MTNLSPAAQAVLDAANYVYDRAGTTGHGLAAALRAVADQVVQHPGRYPMNEYMEGLRDCKQDFYAALRGIADELEACVNYIDNNMSGNKAREFRAIRRPKPPSLKEQAHTELDRLIALIPTEGAIAMAEPLRRALEALPDA